MTRTEQKIYDLVRMIYQKHGYELVSDDETGKRTCVVAELEDEIIITVNPNAPFAEDFIEMMDEIEDELYYEEDYKVTMSKCLKNEYLIHIEA